MHEARCIIGEMQMSRLRHPHGGFEPLACPVWRPTLRRFAVLVGFIAFSSPTLAAGPITLESDSSLKAVQIEPSQTCEGISSPGLSDKHLVILPPKPRKTLVVFLGGSRSNPTDYETISRYAAQMDYSVIDLAYDTGLTTVGLSCPNITANTDDCFTNYRGETLFGENQAYGDGSSTTYSSAAASVSKDDSVVNRLVCALQFIARDEANNGALTGFGAANFLITASASPYPAQPYATYTANGLKVRDSNNNVILNGPNKAYPAWSNIIVAGHSQGGGHAAFLGLNLPKPVKRVVMFSAPNDNFTPPATSSNPTPDPQSASWIVGPSTTPLANFWGLRNASERIFGNFTTNNWKALGGTGLSPNLERGVQTGEAVGDTTSHSLLTTIPNGIDSLGNHNSTAANCLRVNSTCLGYQDKVKVSWNYLFSGGYSNDE